MKHKPQEHLVGNCSSQSPACDTESSPNTQDCVFLSMRKWG
ncbi:rCG29113 [Rattus norvegicus]|uniref:RCG29113 n=1 Tax=Rattus norvegicus TaxID=10116 RepID=A6HUS6_RAT|nr:rCG29113 [Rattus norvegicus]